MKIIKDEIATLKRGRRITLELAPNEHLVSLKHDQYYRLGGQVDGIMQGYVIAGISRVYWCSITQKWEEA